jgi:iron complex transport system ATP-binding protein
MQRDPEEILSFAGLSIGYAGSKNENVLLPPLNASARRGELIALIGKNGIGKSTLLRTIAGLQSSLGGEIVYSGKSISEYTRTELARMIGYISTEIVKVTNMRVYDLVALGRFPYTNWFGRIDASDHAIISEAIRMTGMSALSSRFISELSDGERQKAMIARILSQDTGILVMDEPTAFLDIGSKFEILHLMHLLSQNNGKTIIFSTHDLNVAMSQADKIWMIADNQLIEGAPEDLMLQGSFDRLVSSSAVQYNSENGTYSFITENRGTINVHGEGIIMHYTRKALNRAGFSVSQGRELPCLEIPSGISPKWKLIEGNSISEFSSIYDFVTYLSRENKAAI